MTDHVYKIVEIVGTSPTSIEEAINVALRQATKTVRHIRWFEVLETRGDVKDGRVAYYQVTLKLGFTMES